MKVYYPQNYNELLLFYLAQCQRALNKHNTNDPIAFFQVHNIDFKTLLDLYPEQFPHRISDCYTHSSSTDKEELIIPSHYFNVHSKLIQHRKEFNSYGLLLDKLAAAQITEGEYHDEIRVLNDRIIKDIRAKFEQAILCTVKSRKALAPHVDTLLFACLYFYNTIWDADGLTFNGAVARNNSISDLSYNEQPYYYRMHNQIKDVSQLLFDYYSQQAPPYEINYVVNKRSHIFNDPVSNHWIIQSLIQNIKAGNTPISFDYLGNQLSRLLKLKDKLDNKEFLNRLKRLSMLELPDHINEKRMAIGQFCLEIHKIFTYYLGIDINSFDGKRSKIYHKILLAFQMDDFNLYMRNSEHAENTSSRTDAATNRLGELLRRDQE